MRGISILKRAQYYVNGYQKLTSNTL